MKFLKLISIFVLVVMLGACSNQPALKCNFTSADISTLEDEHVVLAGFAARDGLSDGIHIPLRTHALAVTDGNQKVCIISNDVMEISPALAGEIRTEISKRSGLPFDNILLHCIKKGVVSVALCLSALGNTAWKIGICKVDINSVKKVLAHKVCIALIMVGSKSNILIKIYRFYILI